MALKQKQDLRFPFSIIAKQLPSVVKNAEQTQFKASS